MLCHGLRIANERGGMAYVFLTGRSAQRICFGVALSLVFLACMSLQFSLLAEGDFCRDASKKLGPGVGDQDLNRLKALHSEIFISNPGQDLGTTYELRFNILKTRQDLIVQSIQATFGRTLTDLPDISERQQAVLTRDLKLISDLLQRGDLEDSVRVQIHQFLVAMRMRIGNSLTEHFSKIISQFVREGLIIVQNKDSESGLPTRDSLSKVALSRPNELSEMNPEAYAGVLSTADSEMLTKLLGVNEIFETLRLWRERFYSDLDPAGREEFDYEVEPFLKRYVTQRYLIRFWYFETLWGNSKNPDAPSLDRLIDISSRSAGSSSVATKFFGSLSNLDVRSDEIAQSIRILNTKFNSFRESSRVNDPASHLDEFENLYREVTKIFENLKLTMKMLQMELERDLSIDEQKLVFERLDTIAKLAESLRVALNSERSIFEMEERVGDFELLHHDIDSIDQSSVFKFIRFSSKQGRGVVARRWFEEGRFSYMPDSAIEASTGIGLNGDLEPYFFGKDGAGIHQLSSDFESGLVSEIQKFDLIEDRQFAQEVAGEINDQLKILLELERRFRKYLEVRENQSVAQAMVYSRAIVRLREIIFNASFHLSAIKADKLTTFPELDDTQNFIQGVPANGDLAYLLSGMEDPTLVGRVLEEIKAKRISLSGIPNERLESIGLTSKTWEKLENSLHAARGAQ